MDRRAECRDVPGMNQAPVNVRRMGPLRETHRPRSASGPTNVIRRMAAAAGWRAMILAIALVAGTASHAAATTWTMDGYTILLDGKPFFAQGVGYFPLPLGNESSRPAYGDYFYNFPDQAPVWKPYLDRDLPRMRGAGVNVV